MLARQPLGTKYVVDINILAIYLVENHPGHLYVSNLIDSMISRGTKLVLFDFLPLRAYWIMTSKWKIPKNDAMESIISFLRLPNIIFSCLEPKDFLDAFRLARELRHDVYDVIYIIFARKVMADGIITTDTDFEKLCNKTNIEYINPVPQKILRQFAKYKHK